VLDGLAALHQGGIVHRDVKPDNIIVKRTLGDEVHVTLLDLGFAWVPPERNLTGAPEPTRQVYGTDRFIAPELLGGGLPEPRNDLYSVGALMYSMLTAQSVPDLSAAPEEMEMPSPRAFVPGLPQSVDDIVMRALSDVEARFQVRGGDGGGDPRSIDRRDGIIVGGAADPTRAGAREHVDGARVARGQRRAGGADSGDARRRELGLPGGCAAGITRASVGCRGDGGCGCGRRRTHANDADAGRSAVDDRFGDVGQRLARRRHRLARTTSGGHRRRGG
jgi:hypothetical protein